MAETKPQGRTRRFEYRNGGQIVKPFADAGAARGESLPVYECNRCGRLVVWCTSRKTGRKYLAHTARHTSDGMTVDSWWYNAGSVHTDEACQAEQDRKARDIAHIEEMDAARAKYEAENRQIIEAVAQADLDGNAELVDQLRPFLPADHFLMNVLAEAEASGDAEYIDRARRVVNLQIQARLNDLRSV